MRGSQILFSTLFHRSSQECLSTRHNSVATRTDDAVACTPYGVVLRMEYNTKWLVQAREGYSYMVLYPYIGRYTRQAERFFQATGLVPVSSLVFSLDRQLTAECRASDGICTCIYDPTAGASFKTSIQRKVA